MLTTLDQRQPHFTEFYRVSEVAYRVSSTRAQSLPSFTGFFSSVRLVLLGYNNTNLDLPSFTEFFLRRGFCRVSSNATLVRCVFLLFVGRIGDFISLWRFADALRSSALGHSTRGCRARGGRRTPGGGPPSLSDGRPVECVCVCTVECFVRERRGGAGGAAL